MTAEEQEDFFIQEAIRQSEEDNNKKHVEEAIQIAKQLSVKHTEEVKVEELHFVEIDNF
jgi:hypothetical protein